jgi:hypothetical protein
MAGKRSTSNVATRRGTRGRGEPSKPRQKAWWLSVDVEVCAYCYQPYAYGTGYRCACCDSAVCQFCVAKHHDELRCPEC